MRRLIFVVLASLSCKRGQAFHPPDPSLNRMMEQPRVDPFEEPMRSPPPGALSFSPDGVWDPARETGMVDGKPVANLPVPLTRALIERGMDRFAIACAHCHGVLGDGDSAVARRMTVKKPASLVDITRTPGEIFRTITEGYGFMPSEASVLSRDDRWAVVAYVRVLKRSQRSELATLPVSMQAELR